MEGSGKSPPSLSMAEVGVSLASFEKLMAAAPVAAAVVAGTRYGELEQSSVGQERIVLRPRCKGMFAGWSWSRPRKSRERLRVSVEGLR